MGVSTTLYELYIPCERFEVALKVSPQKGLSPIERLVLESIHAGTSRFRELCALFQLGERPMLDLLLELWQHDYLIIDTDEGTIALTDVLKDRVERQDWELLEGGQRRSQRLELFIERVSGHVLIDRPFTEELPRGRLIPPVLPERAWESAPPDEIDRAIRRRLKQWEDQGSRLELVDYDLPSDSVANSGGRTWYRRIETLCQRGEGEELQLEVVGPTDIPAAFRRDLSLRLTRLAARHKHLTVFKQALAHAKGDARAAGFTLERALELLRGALPLLDAAGLSPNPRPPLNAHKAPNSLSVQSNEQPVALVHAELETLAEDVLRLTEARLEQRGRVTLQPAAEHLDWLIESLSSALRQVVIAFPTIRYAPFSRLLNPIRQALARDVRVALLWGAGRDDVLEPSVQNALEEISAQYRGLDWTPLASGIGAHFVAIDGQTLLITTSEIFLREPAPRDPAPRDPAPRDPAPREPAPRGSAQSTGLGVIFTRSHSATGGASPCFLALELSRQVMPDFQVAQRLRVLPEELEAQYGSADRPVDSPTEGEQQLPSLPAIPPTLEARNDVLHDLRDRPRKVSSSQEATQNADYQRAALEQWRGRWRSFVRTLGDFAMSIGPGADLLHDAEHITQMWARLEGAQDFLVIGSARLTREALSARFLGKLKHRLTQGLRVALVYQRAPEAQLAQELDELARQFTIFKQAQVELSLHLLIDEAECTLSSFPFLTYDALAQDYGRARTHLGLRMRDAEASSQLLNWLSAHVPLLKTFSRPRPSTTNQSVTLACATSDADEAAFMGSERLDTLLQQLQRDLTAEARAVTVELWAASYSDRGLSSEAALFKDLEVLWKLSLPSEDQIRATAAALLRVPQPQHNHRVLKWISHLIQVRLWTRQSLTAPLERTLDDLQTVHKGRTIAPSALWRYPHLWLAHHQHTAVSSDELIHRVLAGIVHPPSARRTLDVLLLERAYDALPALLSDLGFQKAAGDSLHAFKDEVQRAVHRKTWEVHLEALEASIPHVSTEGLTQRVPEPRLGLWPWQEPLEDILSFWIEPTKVAAPPAFHPRWSLADNDLQARQLVAVWQTLLKQSKDPQRKDPQRTDLQRKDPQRKDPQRTDLQRKDLPLIEEFSRRMLSLLAPSPPGEEKLCISSTFVKARIPGQPLSMIPGLAPDAAAGVWLLIPLSADASWPADQEGIRVFFDPIQTRARPPEGALLLKLEPFLARLPRREERSTLLQAEVGRQLPLRRAIPASLSGDELEHCAAREGASRDELHTRLRRCCEAVGVDASRAGVFDLLLYLAAYVPALAFRLLREVFKMLEADHRRFGPILLSDVRALWLPAMSLEAEIAQTEEKESVCRRGILKRPYEAALKDSLPLTEAEQAVLSVLLLDAETTDLAHGMPSMRIETLLEHLPRGSGRDYCRLALQKLEQRGLVERLKDTEAWALRSCGPVWWWILQSDDQIAG